MSLPEKMSGKINSLLGRSFLDRGFGCARGKFLFSVGVQIAKSGRLMYDGDDLAIRSQSLGLARRRSDMLSGGPGICCEP